MSEKFSEKIEDILKGGPGSGQKGHRTDGKVGEKKEAYQKKLQGMMGFQLMSEEKRLKSKPDSGVVKEGLKMVKQEIAERGAPTLKGRQPEKKTEAIGERNLSSSEQAKEKGKYKKSY